MGHFLVQCTQVSPMGSLLEMTNLQAPVRIKEVKQERTQHAF